jgi:hypothetical protein
MQKKRNYIRLNSEKALPKPLAAKFRVVLSALAAALHGPIDFCSDQ